MKNEGNERIRTNKKTNYSCYHSKEVTHFIYMNQKKNTFLEKFHRRKLIYTRMVLVGSGNLKNDDND